MEALKQIFEVFWVFLRLGCVAFGGPTAHLAYFDEAFVRRRGWISSAEYSELVALCHFLPGPGSSQVGFGIGLKRAGIAGAFAAWLGFTAPAAFLMIAFATGIRTWSDFADSGWIEGLLVAAVAVVANAIWNMADRLCRGPVTRLIAVISALVLLLFPLSWLQLTIIVVSSVAGYYFLKEDVSQNDENMLTRCTQKSRVWALGLFLLMLLGLPVLARSTSEESIQIFDAFFRAGSLVFGGGHVVLPLLDSYTVDRTWIDSQSLLAGYGAAQAIPGPLFAFTAYLGAAMNVGWGGVSGGVFALVATYLPAWLLVLGVLPIWERVRMMGRIRGALMGVNAAVVGVLLAAFCNPVLIAGIASLLHAGLATLGLLLLRYVKCPLWAWVLGCAGVGGLIF